MRVREASAEENISKPRLEAGMGFNQTKGRDGVRRCFSPRGEELVCKTRGKKEASEVRDETGEGRVGVQKGQE